MSVIKRLLSVFYVDIHWKLLSLCCAVVLWVVGAHMIDPEGNEPFNLRLDLQNVDILARDNVVLLNEEALREKMIQVVVRGPVRELDALRPREPEFIASKFVPSVDFRAIDPALVLESDQPITLPINVSVNLYPGFEHLSIRPGYVEAVLDARETERFPVEVIHVGEVSHGFELRTIQLNNNHVNVVGARSIIQTVSHVIVQPDVTGLHEGLEMTVPIRVIDKNGIDITDSVTPSVKETTANIPVWPISEIDVVVKGVGELASGFAVAYIHSEPETIDIIALPERLEELENITIEIDLEGASSTFAQFIEITPWLPEGVRLSHGESPNIAVYVTVEPIERRNLTIQRDHVRIRGFEAIYQIIGENEPIRMVVSGPRSVIDNLDISDIELELDLRNLSIGTHYRMLNVLLPEGVSIVGTRPVFHVQIHEPAPEGASDDNGVYDYEEETEETNQGNEQD